MKISRKSMVLGAVGVGIAAVLAGGVGVAQAADTPPSVTAQAEAAGYGTGTAHAPRACLKAAADYLGLSQADLLKQLRGGKSLADVAKDKGKPVPGLQDAMIAAAKSALDANTTLTADQRAKRLAYLTDRIPQMITKVHHPGCGCWRDWLHRGRR